MKLNFKNYKQRFIINKKKKFLCFVFTKFVRSSHEVSNRGHFCLLLLAELLFYSAASAECVPAKVLHLPGDSWKRLTSTGFW